MFMWPLWSIHASRTTSRYASNGAVTSSGPSSGLTAHHPTTTVLRGGAARDSRSGPAQAARPDAPDRALQSAADARHRPPKFVGCDAGCNAQVWNLLVELEGRRVRHTSCLLQ